jgi:hypothetical protein
MAEAGTLRCNGDIFEAGSSMGALLEACKSSAVRITSDKYVSTNFETGQDSLESARHVEQEKLILDFGDTENIYYVSAEAERVVNVQEYFRKGVGKLLNDCPALYDKNYKIGDPAALVMHLCKEPLSRRVVAEKKIPLLPNDNSKSQKVTVEEWRFPDTENEGKVVTLVFENRILKNVRSTDIVNK